jgi:hypothetical protein
VVVIAQVAQAAVAQVAQVAVAQVAQKADCPLGEWCKSDLVFGGALASGWPPTRLGQPHPGDKDPASRRTELVGGRTSSVILQGGRTPRGPYPPGPGSWPSPSLAPLFVFVIQCCFYPLPHELCPSLLFRSFLLVTFVQNDELIYRRVRNASPLAARQRRWHKA